MKTSGLSSRKEGSQQAASPILAGLPLVSPNPSGCTHAVFSHVSAFAFRRNSRRPRAAAAPRAPTPSSSTSHLILKTKAVIETWFMGHAPPCSLSSCPVCLSTLTDTRPICPAFWLCVGLRYRVSCLAMPPSPGPILAHMDIRPCSPHSACGMACPQRRVL